jgi:hypothetical protein
MRAVAGCAILGVLFAAAAVGRADDGYPPAPRFGESQTCEEQCRSERARNDAACDTGMLAESDRALCHEAVRARLDVCLRICED